MKLFQNVTKFFPILDMKEFFQNKTKMLKK